jgi:hypothetical protein
MYQMVFGRHRPFQTKWVQPLFTKYLKTEELYRSFMKTLCQTVLNVTDAIGDYFSAQINSDQLVNCSVAIAATNASLVGTVTVQASNDPFPATYTPSLPTPTNWVDVPNTQVALSGGTPQLVRMSIPPCFQWIRVHVKVTTAGNGSKILCNFFAQGI